MRWRSRRKAHCLGDASSTSASARPRCVPPGTHQSTRHRKAAGSALRPRYISVSAVTTTRAATSTPANIPTATRGKEPTVAIILDPADATIAARTGAQALAYRRLRPSAGTSSTLHSHQGIDHLPISLSTLGRQTLDFGLKTIGLPVKPVVRIMTTSLSATFHYSWPIWPECVWNTYCPTQSRVGRV